MVYNDDDFLSHKIENVPDVFMAIDEDGHSEKIKNLPYFSNIADDHVQGYTQYGENPVCIVTHSVKYGTGSILIKDRNEKAKEIKTNGWYHPNGVQTIGRYLFAGVSGGESSNPIKRKVAVYDMEELISGSFSEKKSIPCNHGCSAMGITDFNISETKNGSDDKVPHYLMLVRNGDSCKYTGYISKVPGKISDLDFKEIGSVSLDNIDGHEIKCEGFGLVTDSENQTYMIALVSYGSKATYADYGYLIKLNATRTSLTYEYDENHKRHFKNAGGITGVDGTHFRWGAGIRICSATNDFAILATSRNIIAGTFLNCNWWGRKK